VTGKSDFTAEEWKTVLEGPPSAGFMVAAAQRGGTFRESVSIASAYAQARKRHGESELLDELTAAKPQIDHTRFRSLDELKAHCLDNVRAALALLRAKASPEEVDEYRAFVKSLSEQVAEAHREGFMGLSGERVSDAERAAVAEIDEAMAG
jgi:F0F1-type ATP synthase membrane subunit b/b'